MNGLTLCFGKYRKYKLHQKAHRRSRKRPKPFCAYTMLACVFLILKPRQSAKLSSRNGCISQWRTNLSWAAFSQSNHVEHNACLKQQNFRQNTFRFKGCYWRFERPQSSSSNLFLYTLDFVKLNTKFIKSWPLFLLANWFERDCERALFWIQILGPNYICSLTV